MAPLLPTSRRPMAAPIFGPDFCVTIEFAHIFPAPHGRSIVALMTEIWLRTNTRVFLLALVPPSVPALLGVLLAAGATTRATQITGLVLIALGMAGWTVVFWQLCRPRIAYRLHQGQGQLWFYLRWIGVIRVPIQFVEGFLLGQGPTLLPVRATENIETSTLVVKLADSAEAYARVEVDRALASWCNHYVTVRGMWCEPLSLSLVNRLNARLAEVSPQMSNSQAAR